MISKIRFSEFSYDIPDSVDFPNPSGYLRRRNNVAKIFAFRTQYSKWYVDRDNPPLMLMRDMEQAGCIVDLIDIEESSYDKILQRAHESMVRELRDQQDRCAKALAAGDAKLQEAETDHANGVIGWDKLDKARRDHAKHRETTLVKLEQLTKDLEDTAEQFGIIKPKDALATARRRVNGLRGLGSRKAELYVELAQMLKGTAVEVAAAQSEIPAEILADYAEDQGIDTSAIREAFANHGTTATATATAAPAKQTQQADKPRSVEVMLGDKVAYNSHFKQFSTEASLIGINYAPAEIRLKSPRTGAIIVVNRVNVHRDAEKVLHADYEGAGYKFRLFNS